MTESVKIDRQELKERNGRDFQDRETGERDRRERQERETGQRQVILGGGGNHAVLF